MFNVRDLNAVPTFSGSGKETRFARPGTCPRDVRLWHQTEVPPASCNFRFRGFNGHQSRGSRLPLLTQSGRQPRPYRSKHPGVSRPHDIASFLLYDPEFPRAVALCVDRITERLHDIEKRHGRRRGLKMEQTRRALEFSLETGPRFGVDAGKSTFLSRRVAD